MGKQSKMNGNGNNFSPAVNLISEGTNIAGEINSNGDIRIDGTVTGTVRSKSKVVIGTTGKVEGEIFCESADVLGSIEGSIEIKGILYLKSSARINGEIQTGKLVVESGAVFNGICRMGQGKNQLINKEQKVEQGTRGKVELESNGRKAQRSGAPV